MKIITKKHWAGFNSKDKKINDWALKSSTENFKIYEEQLEALKGRLNKRNWTFFKSGLHEGRLISFNVGEGLHLDLASSRPLTLRDFNRTTVTMQVVDCWFKAIYDLKYEKVSKTVFDFPSDEPLFGGESIDDWGYDEISAVDDKTLRHEVLFSAGTTILIEFAKFSYKKAKFEGSRY